MALPADHLSRLKLEDALRLREGDVVVYQRSPEVKHRLVDGRAYQVRDVLPGITSASLSRLAVKQVDGRFYVDRQNLDVPVERLVDDALLRVRGLYADGVAVEADRTFHYSWFTRE